MGAKHEDDEIILMMNQVWKKLISQGMVWWRDLEDRFISIYIALIFLGVKLIDIDERRNKYTGNVHQISIFR